MLSDRNRRRNPYVSLADAIWTDRYIVDLAVRAGVETGAMGKESFGRHGETDFLRPAAIFLLRQNGPCIILEP
jgi:hypothetical protein